ncbi:sodium-coupled monocarboxylate transporter 2 isoform X2 [Pipra filicauda]|uniref:Sodium-coupled monocarboxylate transporter 2 isoform X2 n=1 Tax=Pipra filicauda TaxID=649802 RepID=A0A7R5L6D0_9PASS|nr:sodium-coupled monocarboxylate transporter 2 isoform X2 [Pipra filicauda]
MPNFEAPEVKKFVAWDYVVFAALFLVSASIGVFFAVKERKKKTSKEFLVGGKQMTCGPIAFSLTTSFMSAVTVLGTPSEVYRYGASFVLFFLSYALVIIFTAELFLPVFYRSGITSTYEYLELRFNKIVRLAATLIYILQTILYTGIVVYAPSLALNQVTGFDLWGSVAATGIVCTFYCTLGGLKAVVWTDAFQMIVMVAGFLTVLIRGTSLNGGSTQVWEDAHEGSRLNIFDFDADPLRRHTIWTIVIGGTFTWLGIYGVNQSTIQRCISCKSEKHAKLTVAASINALATVTFEDLVKKGFPNLSEKMSTWISKGLCVLYGVLCTSMAAAASLMGGVVQASLSIHGMCGGPMLGLFTLGIVFPCANWKGALGGLLAGITLAFWAGTGSFIYPAPPTKSIPLQLSTLNCTLANGTASLTTAAPTAAPERPLLADTWYSLSYLYFSAIGCLGCAIIGLLISYITGPTKGEDIPPVLIKPVCNLLFFWSERLKTLLWCGVQHDSLEIDFEKKLPKVTADKAFKNSINKETHCQFSGYNPEEKSYTNTSRESRL